MWLMIENSRVFFEKYYGTLTVIQREGIEYGVIDMWEAYISDDQKLFREGRIYYRYHIMSRMGNAVDLVHKEDHKELMFCGDETLKGSKYLWLYNKKNISRDRVEEFKML